MGNSQEYLSSNEASCNQLCRCNVPPNHRPMCSLISQQHHHPRVGHDSPRKKETSRLTHSQRYVKTQSIQSYVWVYQTAKGMERIVAKLVSSTIELWIHAQDLNWISQHIHTQHKESSPSLLYIPSGYAFPSSSIQDVQ